MNRPSITILVLSLAMAVLSVVGFFFVYSLKKTPPFEMFRSECKSTKTYFEYSDLTNQEKLEFTQRAIAVSVSDGQSKFLRIVLDYDNDKKIREKLRLKMFATGEIGKLSLQAIHNGKYLDRYDSSALSQKYLVEEPNIEIQDGKNEIGVLALDNGNCVFKASNLISYQPELPELSHSDKAKFDLAVKGRLSDLEINPGINYFGSADWFDTELINRSGLKIAKYDPKSKKWKTISGIAEPLAGYVIYNPTASKVVLPVPEAYRVPDDIGSPMLQIGWNLLYSMQNFSPGDLAAYFGSDDKHPANKPFALSELVTQGFASDIIYDVQGGALTKKSLAELENKSGGFWFYLKKIPDQTEKELGLSLEVKGVGETYRVGDYVPFTLVVRNTSNSTRYLASSSQGDSCQVGLIIAAQNKQLMSTLGECSDWPSLDELPPGGKKEYNYTWRVPKGVSQEVQIKSYLNYSRLGNPTVVGQSIIKIK